MYLRGKSGVSLVESLISIFLVSSLLVSLIGAFVLSRLSTPRAKHRLVAMNLLKEYIEQEVKAGYIGRQAGESDPNYYTLASPATITVTIDDYGTSGTADDLRGTLYADPYPATLGTAGTGKYKIIGFAVQWNEKTFVRSGQGPLVKERLVTYVSEH